MPEIEATKMIEVYVFLFNDVLLITKIKRAPKVSYNIPNDHSYLECTRYTIPVRVQWHIEAR